ncbi:Dabb family protein [Desulfoprunum benzoelyticum]|uniref:Stress-response A/B barrel domain-containing protein n=1 Tax=Desulfoprunum benzoelyticum TaxID=1506996 RepID=A0A840V5U7_9BACT|nr:Dabb family protein [Desulfoprunum benzoelyticum]MBB5349129.1 hypothetical protein [Desulfoprunum benzoelyticum]MBM9530633.1 Dabb family protein [Desulfoprunum benzoelyticum]
MIKHIVCWKLLDRTVPLEKNHDALAIREALHGLRGRIPGLLHLEVGFDFSADQSSGDIILYSEFANRTDLAGYQHHPLHVEAGKIVRPRTCDRRMIDYEV